VTNEYEEARRRTNIEALESFLGSYDGINLGDMEFRVAQNEQPTMQISGVEISVDRSFSVTAILESARLRAG